MSKVIGFSGSPRRDGNTDRLVRQVLAGAAAAGAETAFFRIPDLGIKGCAACYHCKTHDTCAIPDGMQALYREILAADAVVVVEGSVNADGSIGATKLTVEPPATT